MSCSAIQISQTLSQIWAQTVSVVTDSFPNPTGKAPSLILRGQSTGDTRPDSVTPGDSGSGSLRFRQDLHPCEKRCALSILSRGEMGTKQVLGEQQTAWRGGGGECRPGKRECLFTELVSTGAAPTCGPTGLCPRPEHQLLKPVHVSFPCPPKAWLPALESSLVGTYSRGQALGRMIPMPPTHPLLVPLQDRSSGWLQRRLWQI